MFFQSSVTFGALDVLFVCCISFAIVNRNQDTTAGEYIRQGEVTISLKLVSHGLPRHKVERMVGGGRHGLHSLVVIVGP